MAQVAEDEKPVQSDEWTAKMAHAAHREQGGNLSADAFRFRFARMVESGELVVRKVLVNGKKENVFRRA